MPLVGYTDDETELKDLRTCVDYILSHRETDNPFDVVYSGVTPGDNPTRAAEIVGSFADAGVTWWLEPIAPYRYDESFAEPWNTEKLRTRVLPGPPGSSQ